MATSARVDIQSARAMLAAGAHGYVAKDAAYDELLEAIRSVMNGVVYLSLSIAGHINTADKDSLRLVFALLPREREVAQLLAEGKSTKETAVRLHLSPKTVETHRRNLMEKIQVESIAELTKYAIRGGMTAV